MLLTRGRSFVYSSEELLNKKSVFVSFICSCNIAAVTIDRVQWEHWNSPKVGEHLVPTSDLIVPT